MSKSRSQLCWYSCVHKDVHFQDTREPLEKKSLINKKETASFCPLMKLTSASTSICVQHISIVTSTRVGPQSVDASLLTGVGRS